MKRYILFLLLSCYLVCTGENVYKIQVAARKINYSCSNIQSRIKPTLELERYKIGDYYHYLLVEDFSSKKEAFQFLQNDRCSKLKDYCIVSFTEKQLEDTYATLSTKFSGYYRIQVASFKVNHSVKYVEDRLPLDFLVDKLFFNNRYVYFHGPKYLTKADAQEDISYIKSWIPDALLVKVDKGRQRASKLDEIQITKNTQKKDRAPTISTGIKIPVVVPKFNIDDEDNLATLLPQDDVSVPSMSQWNTATWLYYILVSIGLFLAGVSTIRQMFFVYHKLKSINKEPRRYSFPEIWPTVTILIPGYNEEAVIGDCIKCMLKLDYPREKLIIKVVNDRSTDNTKDIVDKIVSQYPDRLSVIHRDKDAAPGKPAALMDVFPFVTSEIAVVFDADYMPDAAFLKEVIAPFSDPKVGATMGRVIPYNADANVLTRLIDLERRAGYNVELWARNELNLLPVYAGTTGGIRMEALGDVGGWNPSTLAEDTDLSCRLYLNGWDIKYVNHAECYEEATETWQARYKQTRRWAMGHSQCMFKYSAKIVAHGIFTKKGFDAFIFIHTYFISFLTLMLMTSSFFLSIYAMRLSPILHVILFLIFTFDTSGPYLQVLTASMGDRKLSILNIFPILLISSFINLASATDGFFRVLINIVFQDNRQIKWDKTKRFKE